MIDKLEIHNFKSIKSLKLDCKRINIFIGEPNTGKSNILETLGMFSWLHYLSTANLKEFVRFEKTNNLFYDENLEEVISLEADELELELKFSNGRFEGKMGPRVIQTIRSGGTHDVINFRGDYTNLYYVEGTTTYRSPFKYFKFVVQETFPRSESDYLLPPSGKNLMSLILAHKELRSTGQVIDLGDKNPAIMVLNSPGAADETTMDAGGVVLRVSDGKISFLLTADITEEKELSLIMERAHLDSTVLKVAHHGSYTATSTGFLSVVSPQVAVISVGADNDYGHPNKETITRLTNEVGSKISTAPT